MRKIILLALCAIFVSNSLYAAELNLVGESDGINVKVSFPSDPVRVGKNAISVVVTDMDGNTVTDAKIKLYYSMPPVPGMAPMNYKTNADFDGESYTATLDIGMSGDWKLMVRVKRAEGKSTKTEFSFKVHGRYE